LHNVQLAQRFRQLADLLELAGENPFKIRAYRRAAGLLASLNEPVAVLARDGRLRRMPGIGPQIAAKVEELLSTGRLRALEAAFERFPAGLIDVMGLPGVGPKRARSLYEHLGVTGIPDLAEAARARRVRAVPGCGAKSEADMLRNLAVLEKRTGLIPLSLARTLTADFQDHLAACPGVDRVMAAGAVRRWEELVAELNLIALSHDPDQTLAAARLHPLVNGVVEEGGDFFRAATPWGVRLKVTLAAGEQAFWAILLRETGPPAHVRRLEDLARSLRRTGTVRSVAGEEDIYRNLGLPYLPPEIRGDGGEVDRALRGWVPRLLERAQVRGDLHVHSSYSDGHGTLHELAEAASPMGYGYLAVTDHSVSLKVARGLSLETLSAKNRAVDEYNDANPGFRLLKGAEVDIGPDGDLDYPDEVLAGLDLVIASVHSRFNLPQAQMTDRVVKAVQNKYVHILGHPTGRLLNQREPYALDLERVMAAARDHDTWLEVNASPERLDLSAEHIKLAARFGVKVVIGTDAHEMNHLEHMDYGVALVRRAGVDPATVVNTWDAGELLRALAAKKGSSSAKDGR